MTSNLPNLDPKMLCAEWGIPEWRSAEDYEVCFAWPFYRWRWEFRRRRADIRAYFDEKACEHYENQIRVQKIHPEYFEGGDVLNPTEPGFYVNVKIEDITQIGYVVLPNPRIGEQPDGVLIPAIHEDAVRYIDPRLSHPIGLQLKDIEGAIPKHLEASCAVRIEKNEFGILFNIDLPLEPQIKAARKLLRKHYQKNGKVLQKRRHLEKWCSYLRVLDAREACATWSEIAETFYQQGILNRHKDPSGGYCPPPPQAARDLWNAASALRFNF